MLILSLADPAANAHALPLLDEVALPFRGLQRGIDVDIFLGA